MKATNIKIKDDQVKTVTYTGVGHNINTLTFNMDLIGLYYPLLAVDLQEIYGKLPVYLEENQPKASDEDYNLAIDNVYSKSIYNSIFLGALM